MRVSHAWLREWVATPMDIRALTERLTLGGLEVGVVETAAPPLPDKRLIIGEIIGSEPHPTAPHLRVCKVDIGRRAPLTIVCGAANAVAGVKAPVATAGAKLPTVKVQAKNIHGLQSVGMLCSAAELGLEENSDAIMQLQPDAPLGRSVRQYLNLSDSVFEIELTPNRGDCLSILGIAREVSALTGAKLKIPAQLAKGGETKGKENKGKEKIRARCATSLPITLQAPAACPRYVGRAICNLDMAAPTPDWMKERLRRSGLRSLNIVVDVTNYVMLELGQPMHAFDLEKLAGGIVVRQAKKNERLQLLDERTVKLTNRHLVIADQRRAVALAGIMGGKNSAISGTTRHIYFESAFFSVAPMLGKAREFGMHTDASHRFERGVNPQLQVAAMRRATQLLMAFAGGAAAPISEARAPKFMPGAVKISFHQSEIPRLLGVSLPATTVRASLERLGMRVTPRKTGWQVTPPSWRSDVTAAHDLVEEVGRLYGFNRIAARLPSATARVGKHPEKRIEVAQVKQKLVERGYFEALTYSFVDAELQQILVGSRGLELNNPIADNMTVMRQSLWIGLLQAVRKNCNRQHERVRLFEEGKVFLPSRANGVCKEVSRLGGAASGAVLPRQWGSRARAVDFFDIKGDVVELLALSSADSRAEFQPFAHPALHPGRSARIKMGKATVGYVGQLHPSHQKRVDIEAPVYLFELDMSVLANARLPNFAEISRYPAMRRDLAVVVDAEVAAQDVMAAVRTAADRLLTKVELFDIYAGERIEKNRKSFAFGLTFQADSGNLTAGEVDLRINRIINELQRQFNAKLRV